MAHQAYKYSEQSEPYRVCDDYATVAVAGRNIVIEANEWDPHKGTFYVVTLYVSADQAYALAEKLQVAARQAEQRVGIHRRELN